MILMYICICNAITDSQVKQAVADGAHTMPALQEKLGVATNCGRCHDTAAEYLPGGRYASTQTSVSVGRAVENAANDACVAVDGFTAIVVRRA